MSWFYTIFVAGFLFASGTNQLPLKTPETIADSADLRLKQEVVEQFDQTFPLNPDGRVSLSNIDGSITIEAWDKNEVRIEATKVADSKENLDLLEINISAKREYLRIEVEVKPRRTDRTEPHRNHRAEVRFRLQVPRTAVLGEIEAGNGSVRVSDFTNITKVTAVNGNVTAANLRGTVKLSTVNGEVRAAFDRVDATTSVNLETVNGRAVLEVPSDINATIKAESLNGSIANEFGLPVKKGRSVGRDLHGRIGTGEILLKLSSVSGSLMIGRKKDGKSPGSVTNLLNTIGPDDDPDEVSSTADPAAAEAVAAAITKSVKSVNKGQKETQKAVEKIQERSTKVATSGDFKIKLDAKQFDSAIAEGFKRAGVFPEMGDPIGSASPTSVDQRSRSFDVKGTPKVNISASMCDVRVRGWDQQVIKYVLTEERVTRDNGLSITENINETTVLLKVARSVRKARPEELWGIENRFRLEVYVPRKTDLVVGTEKEIRIEGVSGRINLTAGDRPVSVRDSEGSLKLNSGEGLIRIIGFRGDLDLTTTESEVYLEGDFAKISACASDSNVTLTMPATQNASITTNTAIQSEGLNIVRENDRTWRLGNGGPKFDFEFTDGHLVVKNLARVEAN
jgi:hypothetical protein